MEDKATNPSPVKGICELLEAWFICWEGNVAHPRADHSQKKLQEDASWGLGVDAKTSSCINHSCATCDPESNADLLVCRQDSAVGILATFHVLGVNLGCHGFTHHVVDALILVMSVQQNMPRKPAALRLLNLKKKRSRRAAELTPRS